MKGYKVVRLIKVDGVHRRVSVFADNYWETAVVEYIPGKPSFPKADHGPLSVFSDLEEATRYYEAQWRDAELWSCDYEPADTDRLYGQLLRRSEDEYGRSYTSISSYHLQWSCYKSARAAKSVTLVERIKARKPVAEIVAAVTKPEPPKFSFDFGGAVTGWFYAGAISYGVVPVDDAYQFVTLIGGEKRGELRLAPGLKPLKDFEILSNGRWVRLEGDNWTLEFATRKQTKG